MKFPTATQIVIAALLASVLTLVTACSSPPRPFYAQDSFGGNSPFQKHVPDDTALACEAAQRTLLGDGYTIEGNSAKGTFKGRKAYRINGDRSTFVEMSVVCLPDAEGSTVFANGLISAYELKKAPTSASIGLSVIGSVSLPIGQSVDSMVKVSDETITDRAFYQRFFASVEGRLDRMRLESREKAPKEDEALSLITSTQTPSNDQHTSTKEKIKVSDAARIEPVPMTTANTNVSPTTPEKSVSALTSTTSSVSPSSTSTIGVPSSAVPEVAGVTSTSTTNTPVLTAAPSIAFTPVTALPAAKTTSGAAASSSTPASVVAAPAAPEVAGAASTSTISNPVQTAPLTAPTAVTTSIQSP